MIFPKPESTWSIDGGTGGLKAQGGEKGGIGITEGRSQ
jgi:hypothetical protein